MAAARKGRPPIYTAELGAKICDAIAAGRSLRSICDEPGMPGRETVFRWLRDPSYAAFRDQYAQAREDQADALADDLIDIADDGRNDWMERHGGDDAGWVANGENIQRAKLRVDARKWAASKLRPRVYGDLRESREPPADMAALLKRLAEALPD